MPVPEENDEVTAPPAPEKEETPAPEDKEEVPAPEENDEVTVPPAPEDDVVVKAEPLFEEVKQKIFLNPEHGARKCATCHTGAVNPLALTDELAFADLTSERSDKYNRSTRVIPGDADNSLIVEKMSDTPPEGGFGRMPMSGGFYKADSCEIKLLKLWINAGASETMTKAKALEIMGLEQDSGCFSVPGEISK